MNKNFEPQYKWNADFGVATCRMYNFNLHEWVEGGAVCAIEDQDMLSEKTGLAIAEQRATIELYKSQIKYLKIQRDLYQDLYNTYKLRPTFDENDKLVKIVKKRLYMTLNDIKAFELLIKEAKSALQDFLDAKDELYVKVRKLGKEG